MEMNLNTIKGYNINYSTNTISMNFKFAKSAQTFGSPEYTLLKSLKEDFPNMKFIKQSGRKTKNKSDKKRLTYKNIKKHISAYKNSEVLLFNFNECIRLSQPLKSPYKYVCDWFYAQFPDYDNSIKSLYNTKAEIPLVEIPDQSKYELRKKKENKIETR